MSITAPRLRDTAHAVLRARQGPGARYDAPGAPARELLWARRGIAHFARKLNELDDADLAAEGAVGGLPRRCIVAGVGCQARALAERVSLLRTGREPERDVGPSGSDEVLLAATLPAAALRHLCTHAHVHLDVEWRDLTDDDWGRRWAGSGGGPVNVRDTPRFWAGIVWRAVLELGNGARLTDVPDELSLPACSWTGRSLAPALA